MIHADVDARRDKLGRYTHTHTRAYRRARDEAYARYARAISTRERNKRTEAKAVVKRSPEKREGEEHGEPVINHRWGTRSRVKVKLIIITRDFRESCACARVTAGCGTSAWGEADFLSPFAGKSWECLFRSPVSACVRAIYRDRDYLACNASCEMRVKLHATHTGREIKIAIYAGTPVKARMMSERAILSAVSQNVRMLARARLSDDIRENHV